MAYVLICVNMWIYIHDPTRMVIMWHLMWHLNAFNMLWPMAMNLRFSPVLIRRNLVIWPPVRHGHVATPCSRIPVGPCYEDPTSTETPPLRLREKGSRSIRQAESCPAPWWLLSPINGGGEWKTSSINGGFSIAMSDYQSCNTFLHLWVWIFNMYVQHSRTTSSKSSFQGPMRNHWARRPGVMP